MPDEDAVVTQIIDAARKYFLRFGYSRVSTEEIARSIGRSKKTLYKHFATKGMLLHAVLCRVDAEVEREIAVLVAEPEGDRPARLRRILVQVATCMATTHQVLFTDLRTNDPELGEQAWREHRLALIRILHPVLVEAVAKGEVRDDLPVDRMLAILFGCIEGLTTAHAAVADAPSPGFADLISLMVDGLRRR